MTPVHYDIEELRAKLEARAEKDEAQIRSMFKHKTPIDRDYCEMQLRLAPIFREIQYAVAQSQNDGLHGGACLMAIAFQLGSCMKFIVRNLESDEQRATAMKTLLDAAFGTDDDCVGGGVVTVNQVKGGTA